MKISRTVLGYTTLLMCFFGILSFSAVEVHAAQSDRFSGWAWSDNIGWISMNCTNTNSCDDVDYGVTITGTGGTQAMSGWAWSDNIGWINFNETNLVAADRSIHGDALVYSTIHELSSTQSYCNGSDPYQTNSSGVLGTTGGSYDCQYAPNNDDDGWNGVISLSDTSPVAYGPVADDFDNTADGWDWQDSRYYLMDGYAWGGDIVGWIKFSCQDSDGGGPDTNTCGSIGYGTYLDPFFMEFSADQGLSTSTAVEHEGSFNHTWTLIPEADVTSCTGSGGPGTWSDSPNKSTSPSPLSELVTNATSSATSTLACTNYEGKTLERNLYIYVKPPPPIISFTASDYNIPYNSTTDLIWTTENIDSCVASAGDAGWGGSIATGTNITYTTEQLTAQDTTYNMTCESMYPSFYDPVLATLEITVQKLIVDFYAEDGEGNRITDPNELYAYTEKDEIDLVWETEFATEGCQASGDWSGEKVAPNPANDIVDGRESAPIPEGGSYTYVLTCNGEYNQEIVQSVTIRISKNPGFSEEINNEL